jgi:hypothetical protein
MCSTYSVTDEKEEIFYQKGNYLDVEVISLLIKPGPWKLFKFPEIVSPPPPSLWTSLVRIFRPYPRFEPLKVRKVEKKTISSSWTVYPFSENMYS